MNSHSPSRALRLASAFAALLAIWFLAFLIGTAVAIAVAAVATAALLLVAFSDALVSLVAAREGVSVPAPATAVAPTNLGDAGSILALLADAVIAYDAGFRIVFANDAAVSLLGLGQDELRAHPVTPQLLQQDARFARLVQVVYPSLAPVVVPRQDEQGMQVVDLTFSDPELELRVSTTQLPGGKGFLKIIRDRTRTLAIIRGKGEFVTVASHQLRTPLTEISWALETLAGSPTLSEEDKGLAAQTLESVKSLTRTAEDLLGTAKIEDGRFGYHFAEADIAAVLDTELAKALPVVEEAGLRLYYDRPTSPLPPVFVDSEKVVMVLNNLVENALRYNVKNGEITVRAEQVPDEPFVRVSVRDTGIGIAPADVQKLFTKFFRADNAVKAVAGGTGLGLYIASNIVRAHGGQMGVASELGRGTTFSFTLATDRRRVPQHEVAADA